MSSSNSATSISSSYSLISTSSSFATSAQTATSASFATSAASATSASFATNAATATSSSFATNANTATSASFATNATSAATASFLPSTTNLNITSISASTAVFQSASIGYLQTITGSVVNIGDAFIILNTSDATRYAGIKIEDSGSGTPTNYTASFQFDSQTNDWFYEYSGSDPTNFGVTMFGPEYSTIGSPTYLTNNRLSKGNGGHHLNDSTITDNGTNVIFTTPIAGTAISASTGFLGNLTGTASFATNALSASFAPSSPAFPFTGSAGISGSLTVTGSTLLLGPINQGQNNVLSGSVGLSAAIIASSGSVLFDRDGAYTGAIITGGRNNIIKPKFAGALSNRNVFGIFGGYVNTLDVGPNAEANNMFGGYGNTLSCDYGVNTMVGGNNNSISGNGHGMLIGGINNQITTDYGLLFGGLYNQVNGGYFSPLLGGSDNRIVGGNQSSILGGTAHRLNSGGDNSSIIGGNNHTVTHSGSAIIGGSYMSTTAHNTVYVPNLVVSGSLTATVATASYALNAATASSVTTLNQNVTITGSLNATGSITGNIIGNNTDTYTSSPAIQQVVTLTQAEYNAISGSANANTFYVISDSVGFSSATFATTGSNTFNGNQIISGSLNVTGGITGSMLGTASFAVFAIGAGGANSATSASYALSASFATSATNANTASFYSLAAITQNAVFSGSVRGEVKALSIASNTASLDCSTDNFFTLTLVSGSNTFINPSNIAAGQTINLRVTQANPGNGTVSFPTSVKQVSGSSYVPSVGAGPQDIVTFISFDASSLYLSNVKNLV